MVSGDDWTPEKRCEDTPTVHTSAPGKLILFGEHSSRHGKPCIIIAIDQRMHVYLTPREDVRIVLNSPDQSKEGVEYPTELKEFEYVSKSIANFLQETGSTGGFELTTKSEFKMGSGSSAAVLVATLGALNEHFKTGLDKAALFKLAFKTLWDVQGHGSGQDVATSTYGGLVYYIMGNTPEQITDKQLPLVVGNTGIKVPSKPIVKAVTEKEQKYPEVFDKIINGMSDVAIRARKAIEEWDLETIGELMNINQGFLSAEGVSSDILEKLIFAARNSGALGAKLSGAGIGDNMITLAKPGDEQKVAKAIAEAGGKSYVLKTGEGLKVHAD